jgi:hypothetical protein
VISEHGHHRYGRVSELVCQSARLVWLPVLCQVAGDEEDVRHVTQLLEMPPERARGPSLEVKVTDCGDSYHRAKIAV